MEVEWGKNISMDQNKMVKVLNPYLMGINETLEHALRALEAANNLGNHEVLEAASQKQRLSSANKDRIFLEEPECTLASLVYHQEFKFLLLFVVLPP